MTLYFITQNSGKFKQAKEILEDIEQFSIDLPEIQDIDPKKIIKAKLEEAINLHDGKFIIDDTSLYFECLNGLPGPLIKWFLKTIGNKGLYELTQKYGNSNAEAKVIIGYAKSNTDINFFEATVKGKIVSPKGENGFGWDKIFQPQGQDRTYAEMTFDEKNKVSVRTSCLESLKKFLGEP